MLTRCPYCKTKFYTSAAGNQIDADGIHYYICPKCKRKVTIEEAAAREVIA